MKLLETRKLKFYSPEQEKIILFKLEEWSQDLNSDFTLKDFLFESVKLAENADADKYV